MLFRVMQNKINLSTPFLVLFLAIGISGMKGYAQESQTDKLKTFQDDTEKHCSYTSVDGVIRILKYGESFRETRYADDVTGHKRTITVVATCKESKEGIAIVTTIDDQPVAVYVQKHSQRPVALGIGDFVRDTLFVYNNSKKIISLPVTITCRVHSDMLELDMTAILDGQPVLFCVDSEHLYALKRGESVVGTSKIKVKKGWYTKDWYQIVQ
jgi:hypothetical protein